MKTSSWRGFWSGGIIRPFFLRKCARTEVSSFNQLRALPRISKLWFQNNGPTSHTANEADDILRTVFENRINSQNADVIWSLHSSDLTPFDYLWAVKDITSFKCYANHPATIQALKYEIDTAIRQILLLFPLKQ